MKPEQIADTELLRVGSSIYYMVNSILTREPSEVELLAPAGEIDAAYAALHYGADAIYLGLPRFSARAVAKNLSLEELDEITAYARSLDRPRRVFVTINTLIQQAELPDVIESLAQAAEFGVDAVIVQDLGVARLVRSYFPSLALHASTQMAVHNLTGVQALAKLGFSRVILARELTLEEISSIARESGIEVEVFIHGALCYSYSGLCLFSSHVYGRSGNRGKCAYPCREAYRRVGREKEGSSKLAFSMKDLALPQEIAELRQSGVKSLKIEGRMKSPLYVACAVRYYRALLDGSLTDEEEKELKADLQTIFSRPWTSLYVRSPGQRGVVDPDFVGHRGTPIGRIKESFMNRRGERIVRFKTGRPLEVHDGLQIEIPGFSKPYGFPVDSLVVHHHRGKEPGRVLTADADSLVDVALPSGSPEIPNGARVFCSSSQAVKRSYAFSRPKAGLFRNRLRLEVSLTLSANCAAATALVDVLDCPELGGSPIVSVPLTGDFSAAKDADAVADVARSAFARLGGTKFVLGKFDFANPERLFIPISKLNQLRRDLCDAIDRRLSEHKHKRCSAIFSEISTISDSEQTSSRVVSWSIKVDKIDYVRSFGDRDWEGCEELVVDIEQLDPQGIGSQLKRLADMIGDSRLRLALPLITRGWEERELREKLRILVGEGYFHWQIANIGGLARLGVESEGPLDFSFDWSLPVLNTASALECLSLGASSLTFSPEDNFLNLSELLRFLGSRAQLIVYQDTPLYLSQTCAQATWTGSCPASAKGEGAYGPETCRHCAPLEICSESNQGFITLRRASRSVTINQHAFCLGPHIPQLITAGAKRLRADFIYRNYEAEDVARIWRLLRKGGSVSGCHDGNFGRAI